MIFDIKEEIMADKSYSSDQFMDDVLNNMGQEEQGDGKTQSQVSNDEVDALLNVDNDEDMSTEDLMNDLDAEMNSQDDNKETADSQNETAGSEFDDELLAMLDNAEVKAESIDADETPVVGFTNNEVKGEAIYDVDNVLDAVAEKQQKDNIADDAFDPLAEGADADDAFDPLAEYDKQDDAFDPLAEDADAADAFDPISDESEQIGAPETDSEPDDSETAFDPFGEDESSALDESGDHVDSADALLTDEPFKEPVEESGSDNADFFSELDDAIDVNDIDLSDEDDDAKSKADVPDFTVSSDAVDDIGDDIDDITMDEESDPKFEELNIDIEDDSSIPEKEASSVKDLYSNGVSGMLDDDKDVASESSEKKAEIDSEPVKVEASPKPAKEKKATVASEKRKMSFSGKKIMKAVTIGLGSVVLIGAIGAAAVFGPALLESNGQQDVQVRLERQISDLRASMQSRLDEISAKASNSEQSEEVKAALAETMQSIENTEMQLRSAIADLASKTDADKAEITAMNQRALMLMDRFIDDTKVAQEKLSESVFARVVASVEANNTNQVDPRYIESLATNIAENKALTESLSRRVQTQMNIINVLESENSFLKKRVVSLETETQSIKSRPAAQATTGQQSQGQVYLEVKNQDGQGVGGYFTPNSQPAEQAPLFILKGVFENIDGSDGAVIYIAPFNAPSSRPVDYRIGDVIPGMGKVLSIEKLKGDHRVPYVVNTESGSITGQK